MKKIRSFFQVAGKLVPIQGKQKEENSKDNTEINKLKIRKNSAEEIFIRRKM